LPDSRASSDPPPSPALPQWEPLGGRRLLVRAPAKLNLSLRVMGRRPDGFHELDSLVAKITLYDELILAPLPDGRLELTCDSPDVGPIEKNLAFRAARLLAEHLGSAAPGREARGVSIKLHKRIAVGAGLGGGSSDAAAALVGLNRLWGAHLGNAQLSALGGRLGSDVPLFLAGPASRMRGRGEVLVPVALPAFWAVLICPPAHCSTGKIYSAYDQMPPLCSGPLDVALLEGRPVDQWPALLKNDLFRAACAVCPQIQDWAGRVAQTVGRKVLMTGSGSGLFVLLSDFSATLITAKALKNQHIDRCEVVSINPW
jgi:4-diphosphocytidyl-2-C-methyl-D-erythritol kinase